MHLEDLLVLDNGFINAASAQKSAREIVSRFILIRYGCETGGVPGDSSVEIAFGYKRVRKIAGRLGVVGLDLERLLIMRYGVISAPDAEQRNTKIVLCFRISGINRSGFFVMGNCLVELTLLDQKAA